MVVASTPKTALPYTFMSIVGFIGTVKIRKYPETILIAEFILIKKSPKALFK